MREALNERNELKTIWTIAGSIKQRSAKVGLCCRALFQSGSGTGQPKLRQRMSLWASIRGWILASYSSFPFLFFRIERGLAVCSSFPKRQWQRVTNWLMHACAVAGQMKCSCLCFIQESADWLKKRKFLYYLVGFLRPIQFKLVAD